MLRRSSSFTWVAIVGLAACSADRPVSPTAEPVDGVSNTIVTASTITAAYDLTVGQTVRIVPRTTTRTNRLRWSTTNSRVATVNSNGVVSAVAAGTATVTVSGSIVPESYAIAVAAAPPPPPPATLTSFSLQPATAVTLNVGQTRQFTTSQIWSDGLTRTSGVTFTSTGGTISSSGLFTAGNLAGTFMVIASCSCGSTVIADTTPVTVNAVAQLTKLTVSPKAVSIAAGATQQFGVSANWSTGATDVPPVSWSASGGNVSSSGVYVAPSTAGTYRVIVAHVGGTARDTATVTVTGGSSGGSAAAPVSGVCPNEPGGYTPYGTVTFSTTAAPAGWSILGIDRILTTDATAPHASTSVAFKHEAGSVAGQIGIFQTADFPTTLAPKRVYSCTVFRQSANYIQNGSGTKFIYTPQVSSGTRPIQFQMYPVDRVLSPGGAFRWRMEMQTSDPQRIYDDNVTPSRMSPGRWYRLEFVAIMNTPGVKDGTLMWWTSEWNGSSWNAPVQNARHTNVLIAEANLPAIWRKWEYNLFYGGCCSDPLPADQFIELNRVYVSTAK